MISIWDVDSAFQALVFDSFTARDRCRGPWSQSCRSSFPRVWFGMNGLGVGSLGLRVSEFRIMVGESRIQVLWVQ